MDQPGAGFIVEPLLRIRTEASRWPPGHRNSESRRLDAAATHPTGMTRTAVLNCETTVLFGSATSIGQLSPLLELADRDQGAVDTSASLRSRRDCIGQCA
jgi:hypothetical protein